MEFTEDKPEPGGLESADTASPMLRVVQQKNRSSGCGPAVVATVAGTTYEEAIMAMWGRPLTRNLFSSAQDLKRGLSCLGFKASSPKRAKSFSEAKRLSIFACREGTPHEHWVVFDPQSGLVYDPQFDVPIEASVAMLDVRYRPFKRVGIRPAEPA